MSAKERLTVSRAKKIAKAYLKDILGEEAVFQKEGVICYRGPLYSRDYMLTLEEGFDESNMILTVKRIPLRSEGIEGFDWIDDLYGFTDFDFSVNFISGEDGYVFPYFKYNYWFSTLNSEDEFMEIIGKAAVSDVAMREMIFQKVLEDYLEEDEE